MSVVGGSSARDIRDRLEQGHGAVGQLPHGADDLRMARMADQDDVPAALVMRLRLPVHLGDQRTGRVDGEELPLERPRHGFWHPVGREDHRRVAIRHLVEFAHEHRALPPQVLHHVFVMDDLVAHIDRRAMDRRAPAPPHRWRARRPAQNPRGAQSRMSRGGLVMMGRCGETKPLLSSGSDAYSRAGRFPARRRIARTATPESRPEERLGISPFSSCEKTLRWRDTQPPTSAFLPPILTFCGAAVVAVPLFRLLGLSAVLGYLAAGVVIGPSGLALVGDPETIATVAELGVVLLLFIIGLELKLGHLWSMKRDIFGLGLPQLVVTALVPWRCASLIGFSTECLRRHRHRARRCRPRPSRSRCWTSATISRRRTAQRSFAILLFQDLSVVPILAILPLLAGGGAALESALDLRPPDPLRDRDRGAIAAVVLVGRYGLNPFFRVLARTRRPRGDDRVRARWWCSARRCSCRKSACPWPWARSWPGCCWPNRISGISSKPISSLSAACCWAFSS